MSVCAVFVTFIPYFNDKRLKKLEERIKEIEELTNQMKQNKKDFDNYMKPYIEKAKREEIYKK